MKRQLIGFRLREQRRRLGLTQAAVARQVGISASYLNLIEANKRSIAGRLLLRLSEALGLDPDSLTGHAERRLVDDLLDAAADPLARGLHLEEAAAGELVGRHPDWAQAVRLFHRAYREQATTVTALSDRLQRDPFLRDTVHQMLTQIATLRSTADILHQVEDLEPERRRRFQSIVAEESEKLSGVAQALATFFDKAATETRSITAYEEVDDLIIGRGNHFPALEEAAEALRAGLGGDGEASDAALTGYLLSRHGVRVEGRPSAEAGAGGFRNFCAYDAGARSLTFLDSVPDSTRRFQLARLAAELGCRSALAAETAGAELTTPQARAQAFRALASYVASAVIFPYDRFHADAVAARYDVEVLRQRYGASLEQVCHRLVTLRRPGREGVPFGFLRSNPAGFITKRFPLPGLPLSGQGHACPLWAVYGSFQTPFRMVRQLVEFPDGARYLLVARTVAKQPATFREPPFLHAVMLACDAVHADQTVYGDGLDLADPGSATPVGPSCRLCPRRDCPHRAEEPIVDPAGNKDVPRMAVGG